MAVEEEADSGFGIDELDRAVPRRHGLRARLRRGALRLTRRWLQRPEISVVGLQIREVGLFEQRYCITVRLDNPNRLPLPIRVVHYQIELMGQRFAAGETTEAFRIPARGSTDFSLNVNLSMLRLASSVANFLLRPQADIPYRIHGDVELDLPLLPAVPFSHAGQVELAKRR